LSIGRWRKYLQLAKSIGEKIRGKENRQSCTTKQQKKMLIYTRKPSLQPNKIGVTCSKES